MKSSHMLLFSFISGFVPLESALTLEERTSYIEFQGPVSVANSAAYQTDCKGDNAPAPPPVCYTPPATKASRAKATGVVVSAAVPDSTPTPVPV